VPVYRYYSDEGHHFYTINKSEGDFVVQNRGFQLEDDGRPCWHVLSRQCACCGTVPFYRWHNPASGDYLYTTHPTGEVASMLGYVYQGMLGYVFPSDASVVGSRKPLYRWSKIAGMMWFSLIELLLSWYQETRAIGHQLRPQ
jgi:hypothetical protein